MRSEPSDSLYKPDKYVVDKHAKERRQQREFAKPIIFRWTKPGAQQVVVVGTFNKWDTEANPMERLIDGAWQVVIELPRGHHEYCFLVDGVVTTDPTRGTVPDGQGGKRNVLEVS